MSRHPLEASFFFLFCFEFSAASFFKQKELCSGILERE